MTQYEAEKLLNEMYHLWVRGGEIESREQRIWMNVLQDMDCERADKVVDKLYEVNPPGSKFTRKALPPLPLFKSIYYGSGSQASNRDWCPCCDGTGFIVVYNKLDGQDVALRCHCRTGKPRHEKACGNKCCQNQKGEAKLRFRAGYYVKYPHEIKGWKTCIYNPAIIEEILQEDPQQRVANLVKQASDSEIPF